MKWAYCVTSVVARRDTLLPQTLASLAAGGFPEPALFVDGCNHAQGLEYEARFPSLSVTTRNPSIRTFGNWVLALAEIYIRMPDADRFLVAQDDFICVRDLRQYLEAIPYAPKTYQNCYLFPSNENLAPKDESGKKRAGWYPSNQMGRGAVALVFDRETALTLLSSRYMADRPQSEKRGWRAVDGGIVSALKLVGYTELVHYPGLIQHTGVTSTMGNRAHLQCLSFPGETHSALDFLPVGVSYAAPG